MKNKKGAETSTITVVIALIVGLALLLFLILSFTSSGATFWDKVKIYFGGGVNVQDIKNKCTNYCITDARYEYCCLNWSVRFEQDKAAVSMSCDGDARLQDAATCSALNCADRTTLCSSKT